MKKVWETSREFDKIRKNPRLQKHLGNSERIQKKTDSIRKNPRSDRIRENPHKFREDHSTLERFERIRKNPAKRYDKVM